MKWDSMMLVYKSSCQLFGPACLICVDSCLLWYISSRQYMRAGGNRWVVSLYFRLFMHLRVKALCKFTLCVSWSRLNA